MTAPKVGAYFQERPHAYYLNGQKFRGATAYTKLQDITVGGDLAIWGGGLAADFILGRKWNGTSRDEIRAAAMKAVTAKRDIGTLVHQQIENILLKRPVEPTTETAPYIYAFSSFLADERPEFLEVEAMVFNLELGYAGRLDFIARFPKRGNRVGLTDVKTGSLRLSHKLQAAAYEECEGIGLPDQAELKPLPVIEDEYVLLLRPDSYELVPLNVTDADRAHFRTLVTSLHAIKAWEAQATLLQEEAA